MKLITILAAGALLLSQAMYAEAATTAERHLNQGATCAACHTDKNFEKPVHQDKCLACHGSYEKLAQRTEKVHPNPHNNHFGQRDCSTCHKGHQQSELTCDRCHKFDLKTP